MSSPPNTSNLMQFNLRTLFVGVAILAILFAALRLGGWGSSVALLTFAALVAAHVVGNALGTRLRDQVSPQLNPRPVEPPCPIILHGQPEGERRLHEHTPLGRSIRVTSGGAAMVGAILGGTALAAWTNASLAGWIVGTLSSALLGGFFGFLLASFLEMTIRAWWQASSRR